MSVCVCVRVCVCVMLNSIMAMVQAIENEDVMCIIG